MNRNEFIELAEVRIVEAELLLQTGHYDGAYYLAGYAVECALKACIAKLIRAEEFPPLPTKIKEYYTHDLNVLIRTAGLWGDLQAEIKANPSFQSFYDIVKDWKSTTRYERRARDEAEALISAINDPLSGVLPWLRKRW